MQIEELALEYNFRGAISELGRLFSEEVEKLNGPWPRE